MASRSLVANAFVCSRCQRYLARSALVPLKAVSASTSPLQPAKQARRSFHFSSPRVNWSQGNKQDDLFTEDVENSVTDEVRSRHSFKDQGIEDASSEAISSSAGTEENALKPWYLQEQAQEPDVNPFEERQRIPEIPGNAPPILEPLLKHVSVDLGLDYLTLLDLRKLDPPPALGANLVMLFGSARSEKHLNVSADRLCRWLRMNYKLTPIADGLLGRNELKLKLKRKNRRARIMSAAGASTPTDPDDGITTGWICVNAGTVEDGPEKESTYEAEALPKFVGFGSEVEGTKLVVQIMTENKRGELDLEGLWGEALAASVRRSEGARRAREKALTEQDSENLAESHEAFPGNSGLGQPSSSQPFTRKSPMKIGSPHVRSFHTFERRRYAEDINNWSPSDDAVVTETAINRSALPQYGPGSLATGSSIELDVESQEAVSRSDNTDTVLSQLDYLKSMKPNLALWLLGSGQEDKSSTAFLKSFHQSMPIIPNGSDLFAGFELHCYAMKIGHPGYTRDRLVKLLREMQAAAIFIPEETFLMAFETVLMAHNAPPGFKIQREGQREIRRSTDMLGQSLRRILRFAFEVLERMESYGHDVRSNQVFTILHDAIDNPVFEPPNSIATETSRDSPTATKLEPSQHAQFRHFFRRALDALYVPTATDNTLYTHLLRSYVAASPPDWSSFWELWHSFARLMRPRTAEMYALMFNGVASASHAAKCQETLMYQFPEMEREVPIVECKGEVAGSVLECLIKARVPRDAPPWKEMWEITERGL